jgi:hypothetical protein
VVVEAFLHVVSQAEPLPAPEKQPAPLAPKLTVAVTPFDVKNTAKRKDNDDGVELQRLMRMLTRAFKGPSLFLVKNEREEAHVSSTPAQLVGLKAAHSPVASRDPELDDFKRELLKATVSRAEEGRLFDSAFVPNNPSRYAPATSGPTLFIEGLMRFMITQGQEKKIFLAKIAGKKRDYRVSVIVDGSFSLFGTPLGGAHALQTLMLFLRTLSQVDIPSFDLIVATAGHPQVITLNSSTQSALNFETFEGFAGLLEMLRKPSDGTNLTDAFRVAINARALGPRKYCYAFCFTDGLLPKAEVQRVKEQIALCGDIGIDVIGVAVGMYPTAARDLFSRCVWTARPAELSRALMQLFVSDASKVPDMTPGVPAIVPEQVRDFVSLAGDPERIERVRLYQPLVEGLSEIQISIMANGQFRAGQHGKTNAQMDRDGEQHSMYKRGVFNTQKILVVCLWSKTIAGPKEQDFIQPKWLTARFPGTGWCVADALTFFGIKLEAADVISNYRQAIEKMKIGRYYAVWAICGRELQGRWPDQAENPYLCDKFTECVSLFWKAGGAVVWWCDRGLDWQCNEWLEQADFGKWVPGGKTALRITRGSDGRGTMKVGNLESGASGVSSDRDTIEGTIQRPSLSHNLATLYEGWRFAKPADERQMAPFQPFARDTGGNICSMFWLSPSGCPYGDVIIDCGFTKLFTEIAEKGENDRFIGTLRYIQNIAALTMACEKRMWGGGEVTPEKWRPAKFEFEAGNPTARTRPGAPALKMGGGKKPHWILVLDKSCSMSGVYGRSLVPAVNGFVDRIAAQGGVCSIVNFDHRANIVYERGARHLPSGDPPDMGGTSFDVGMLKALEVARRSPAEYQTRVMFFTDGGTIPTAECNAVWALGVSIHAVGYSGYSAASLSQIQRPANPKVADVPNADASAQAFADVETAAGGGGAEDASSES